MIRTIPALLALAAALVPLSGRPAKAVPLDAATVCGALHAAQVAGLLRTYSHRWVQLCYQADACRNLIIVGLALNTANGAVINSTFACRIGPNGSLSAILAPPTPQ